MNKFIENLNALKAGKDLPFPNEPVLPIAIGEMLIDDVYTEDLSISKIIGDTAVIIGIDEDYFFDQDDVQYNTEYETLQEGTSETVSFREHYENSDGGDQMYYLESAILDEINLPDDE